MFRGSVPTSKYSNWQVTAPVRSKTSSKTSTPSPSLWFLQTFRDGYPRSVAAMALSNNAHDIIHELESILKRSPHWQLLVDLHANSANQLDQVHQLFRHLDMHAEDVVLVSAFQRAFWSRGGAKYAMQDMSGHSGGVQRRDEDDEGNTPPVNLTGWFPKTFQANLPRSLVVYAMMDSIGDVIQKLAPTLVPLHAVRAQLLSTKNSADKVNILFDYLDAHSLNHSLLSAFQQAVYSCGGVSYLLNPELGN
ncbi:hypothetical protein C8F01DRAFT_1259062 [Mycena amicta]|nr:hypothetical protein C8F01DRAFT_1259062 [Mycena amicta]